MLQRRANYIIIFVYNNTLKAMMYMKIFVASDIHGSAYYCKKLLAAAAAEQPDKILLLGDLLYHGPRNDLPRDYAPKHVIAMLNEQADKLLCVRGNCEAEVDQMVLNFPVMADYAVLYAGGRAIYATHGHLFGEDNPPKLQQGDVLLCGHTHVAKLAEHGGYVYANPGSVSIPKEQTPQGYIIITDDGLAFKTLDGEQYNKYSF